MKQNIVFSLALKGCIVSLSVLGPEYQKWGWDMEEENLKEIE
jgi:hypothetical protein